VKKSNPIQQAARQRAQVILQVRSGQITAKEGARQLGISRKTYYQWEKRALQGMIEGLEEQPPGRPPKQTDPQRQALQTKVQQLEAELEIAKQTAAVRGILREMERVQQNKTGSKKKKKRLTSGKS
jgi:transposase-like protein